MTATTYKAGDPVWVLRKPFPSWEAGRYHDRQKVRGRWHHGVDFYAGYSRFLTPELRPRDPALNGEDKPND